MLLLGLGSGCNFGNDGGWLGFDWKDGWLNWWLCLGGG